ASWPSGAAVSVAAVSEAAPSSRSAVSSGAPSGVSSFSAKALSYPPNACLHRGRGRALLRADGTEHADRPEQPSLVDPDPLEPHELQEREEGQDHVSLRLLRREQLQEVERLALLDEREQLFHPDLDRLALRLDLVGEEGLAAVEHLLEGRDEVEEPGLQHLLARVVELREHAVRPEPGGRADLGLLVEDARGLLVALELEEALHELGP